MKGVWDTKNIIMIVALNIAVKTRSDRMKIYHGTNVNISDGLASGSYLTDNIEIAREYAKRKNGNTIYKFDGEVDKHFYKDIFKEHYIAGCFIPLQYLIKMEG